MPATIMTCAVIFLLDLMVPFRDGCLVLCTKRHWPTVANHSPSSPQPPGSLTRLSSPPGPLAVVVHQSILESGWLFPPPHAADHSCEGGGRKSLPAQLTSGRLYVEAGRDSQAPIWIGSLWQVMEPGNTSSPESGPGS